MKFLALVSGGKDSHYNILHCMKNGHELVAMANIRPKDLSKQELDSFMFQTCGHDLLSKYPEVSSIPIEFGSIEADTSIITSLTYENDQKGDRSNDEIEQMYDLLRLCCEKYDIEGVSVGAILSSYQRNRVEDCCNRLNLKVLSYLWQRNQKQLMKEICAVSKQDFDSDNEVNFLDARIIKTAAIGLNGSDLGKSLPQIRSKLERLNSLYDVHICGEGGEFETLVLDSPIFDKGYFKLKHVDVENNNDNNDDVYSCTFSVEIVPKTENYFDLEKYLQGIAEPTLLASKWKNIQQTVLNSPRGLVISNEGSYLSGSVELPLTVCKIGDLLHIQNIQPLNPKTSVENQCGDIFKQLFDILHSNNISKKQILNTTLSLKNMGNFYKINQSYVRFFSNIGALPPSRACIGNKLIPGELQLSCIITLNDENNSLKDGIHVQGVSYWNPCNIGPYSQVIYPPKQTNKVGYMAGQIPLIPNTMTLNKPENNGIEEWIENTVVTLRHYDHLKNLVGLKHNLLTICYLSNSSIQSEKFKSGIITSVTDLWTEYAVSNSTDELEQIKHDFAYEDDEFIIQQNPSNFVVVIIDELPAAAPIEIGGVVCGNLDSRDLDNIDSEVEDNKVSKSLSEKGVNVFNDHISYNYSIEFFSNIDDFLTFVSDLEYLPFQGTVYFNYSSLKDADSYPNQFLSFQNLEYFPVRQLFDYRGNEYIIALANKSIII